MVTERIDIEINDKISNAVSKKIHEIGGAARTAHKNLLALRQDLNKINPTKLLNSLAKEATLKTKVAIANNRLAISNKKVTIESERLAQAQARTAAAQARAAAAKDRAIITNRRLIASQKKVGRSSRELKTDLGGLLIMLTRLAGTGYGIATAIRAADAYVGLQNRIKIVTDSTGQLNAVTERLFDIANRTRSSIESTTTAFVRFDLALKQLGAGQEETLRLTETINKALIVGGKSASEQAAALLQISQAFNKGKLDGDEFRTVMETMPEVADAIAKKLGVARGELLNLAPQGKITSAVMREALADAAEEIDEKFAKTVVTIGQAWTVARNRTIKYFGELDNGLGVIRLISNSMLLLSKNLDKVAVAAVAVGAAMAVAFGPRIIMAIKAATAAMAANPLGLLIVGTTTLIALMIQYKDEIKLTSDGFTTLGDTTEGVFNGIWNSIKVVGEFLVSAWNAATDAVETDFTGFFGFVKKVLGGIFKAYKFVNNKIIGLWVGTFEVVRKVWGKLPDFIGSVLNSFSARVLRGLENLINKIIDGMNTLLKAGNRVAKFFDEDAIDVKISKVDFSAAINDQADKAKKGAADIADTVSREFANSMDLDYIGGTIAEIGNMFKAEIRKVSAGRLAEEHLQNLQKISGRFSLRGEGTGAGSTAGKKDESTKPEKLDTDTLSAGRLAEEHLQNLQKISELDDQISLLNVVGDEYKILNRYRDIENQFLNQGIELKREDSKEIMNKLQLLQRESRIQGQLQTIYDETIGRQKEFEAAIVATNRALGLGIINQEEYIARMMELGQIDISPMMLSIYEKIGGDFTSLIDGMNETMSDFFSGFINGFADAVATSIVEFKNLGDLMKDLSKLVIKELIASIIKLGIQYAIFSMIQKSTAIASMSAITAASIIAAKATALAWAPAATAVSLGTAGANSAAASAGIAQTAALMTALSTVPGFAEGGYTGNVDPKQVAGVVHGGEYVMNANAVNRIGLSTLESMNNGKTTEGGGRGPLNVRIINVDSKDAIFEYMGTDEGDELILNALDRNSETVKSIMES